jgi:hypothetical protein
VGEIYHIFSVVTCDTPARKINTSYASSQLVNRDTQHDGHIISRGNRTCSEQTTEFSLVARVANARSKASSPTPDYPLSRVRES